MADKTLDELREEQREYEAISLVVPDHTLPDGARILGRAITVAMNDVERRIRERVEHLTDEVSAWVELSEEKRQWWRNRPDTDYKSPCDDNKKYATYRDDCVSELARHKKEAGE